MSFNPLIDGMKITMGMDWFATSFAPDKLTDIYYNLSASPEDKALLCESADFAEMDDFFNPGQAMILEAVTVKRFSQVESKMRALVRVLNKHGQNGITAGDAVIGTPKKSGMFATVTVQVPLSDGQNVSIVFHSPSGDDRKIMPDDTIVAFIWRLNKRDITHAVSPERGRDVSLEQVCQRVMQIAAKNSDAFQKEQEAVKADQTELAELTTQIETMQTTNADKIEELTDLQQSESTIDIKIGEIRTEIGLLEAENEELQIKIDGLKSEKATEAAAAAKIAAQELKNLPDGWEGVQTSLGWTYVKTFGDETIGVEVTVRGDDTFNVETVSKGGAEREGHFVADDLSAAHANALEKMNAIDQAHVPATEGDEGVSDGADKTSGVKYDNIRARLAIGDRPSEAPAGHLIFNAPRPIYGHKDWEGDFNHGVFYAAVDPNGDRADWMIEENRSLDAWILEFRTKEQIVDIAKRWFADDYPEYAEGAGDRYGDDQYIDSLSNHLDQKAKTYGELAAFLAKYEGTMATATGDQAGKPDFQTELDAASADANPGYNPKESVQHIEKIVKAYGGAVSWKMADYESFENIFYGEITHPDSVKTGFTAITHDGKAVFGVDGVRIPEYYATADDETQEAAIDAMFKLMIPQIVAVLPPADQADGMPAKRAAKLLIAFGLDHKVMTEEVHKVISNGSYQDLVIEAHPHLDGSKNRQIMFTQYIEEGGDKIIDSEVIFAVNPYVGLLKLNEIGYRGPMGEIRRTNIGRPERGWANTFTKNLIDQGFEAVALEQPDQTVLDRSRKTVDDAKKEAAALYAEAQEKGLSPIDSDQFMKDVNGGNRVGASLDYLKKSLAGYVKDIEGVKDGKVMPARIVGAGGTKAAALKWLSTQMAELEYALSDGGYSVLINVRNYISTLRDLLKTGRDTGYMSDEEIARQKADDEAAAAERNAEEQALIDKANANNDYEVGSKEGMRDPLTLDFTIDNTEHRTIAALADIKTPQGKYEYLKNRVQEQLGSLRQKEMQFNRKVDLNSAVKKGIEFGYFSISPRKGYLAMELVIDLKGEPTEVEPEPTTKGNLKDLFRSSETVFEGRWFSGVGADDETDYFYPMERLKNGAIKGVLFEGWRNSAKIATTKDVFNTDMPEVEESSIDPGIASKMRAKIPQPAPEPEPQPEETTMPEQPEAVTVANDLLAGKYDDMNPAAIADLIEPIFELPEDQYLDLMEKVDAYATALAKKAAA